MSVIRHFFRLSVTVSLLAPLTSSGLADLGQHGEHIRGWDIVVDGQWLLANGSNALEFDSKQSRDIYVSIVAAGRNDGYGGGRFVDRAQRFVDSVQMGVCGQESMMKLGVEVVVVEYSPPPSSPLLAHLLRWDRACGGLWVRSVVVPAAVHEAETRRGGSSERGGREGVGLSFLEHVAKNAGVRSASGRYKLVTNPDILFSEEVFAWLGSAPLLPDAFYSSHRQDLGERFTEGLGPRLEGGVTNDLRGGVEWVQVSAAEDLWPFGTLTVPAKQYERRMVRRETNSTGKVIRDPSELHTNAAGDFFLMHGERWQQLRGLPELHSNMEMDSHLCVAAAAALLKQVVLLPPLRLFHQWHQGTLRLHREEAERGRGGSRGERVWLMYGLLLAGQAHRYAKNKSVTVAVNSRWWGLCCFWPLPPPPPLPDPPRTQAPPHLGQGCGCEEFRVS